MLELWKHGDVAAIFYDCDLPVILPLILLDHLSQIETLILENDLWLPYFMIVTYP